MRVSGAGHPVDESGLALKRRGRNQTLSLHRPVLTPNPCFASCWPVSSMGPKRDPRSDRPLAPSTLSPNSVNATGFGHHPQSLPLTPHAKSCPLHRQRQP